MLQLSSRRFQLIGYHLIELHECLGGSLFKNWLCLDSFNWLLNNLFDVDRLFRWLLFDFFFLCLRFRFGRFASWIITFDFIELLLCWAWRLHYLARRATAWGSLLQLYLFRFFFRRAASLRSTLRIRARSFRKWFLSRRLWSRSTFLDFLFRFFASHYYLLSI